MDYCTGKLNAKFIILKNAGSHWESNPGPLTLATSALRTELGQ